jgi:TetR/AcrR family transcriptional regulator, transcriptional repressor for nem operon
VPRTKEFDETEVLDRALELFRARGFKQTSFDDLTRQLGVSRQSLYDTYGDKNTLFHAALRRYLAGGLERMSRTLDNPAPIREVMGGLFEGIISANSAKGCSGCLTVNTMVELAPHDPEIRELAAAHERAIEGLLAGRFGAAQRQGEIAADRDPAALARFYYHVILGLGVAIRAFSDPESLRPTVHMALESLS